MVPEVHVHVIFEPGGGSPNGGLVAATTLRAIAAEPGVANQTLRNVTQSSRLRGNPDRSLPARMIASVTGPIMTAG